MKKKNTALLMGLFLAIGTSSEAVLIAYEGFDYPAGPLDSRGVAGDGWSGSWSGANYNVVTNSLEMPNLPFSTVGGSIIGQSTTARDFTGIDLSTDAVYYASFIIQRTGWGAEDNGGEWFDFHLRGGDNSSAVQAGIASGETFAARIALDSTRHGGDAASTEPFFMVVKIEAHASGSDKFYVKAYSASNTIDLVEATSWTVASGTADVNIVTTMLKLWAGTDDDEDGLYQAAVDEIRIGTTWEDVVPAGNLPDLIAYEGFDYPEGLLTGKGLSVDGWTGAWRSSSNYTVVAGSLDMPNLPFTPSGGSIIGQDTANRNFTGIDLSKDAVYYASFIMQRTGWGAADGSGEWFDFHFRTTGYAKATQAGISSSEEFQARVSPESMGLGGDAASTEPYFIVTKVVAHATAADEIYLQAYSASDTIDLLEVASWTVTGGFTNTDLFANMVTLWAGKDDDADGLYQAAIDEIRIGRTWEAVVPVTILLPSTIISLKPFGSNVMEMVVNVPNPSLSHLKGTADLVFGNWTNAAHSIDGNAPFLETNLTYSTPSGQDKVIYVETGESPKFFKIDTGE